jgi:hypothetical protein
MTAEQPNKKTIDCTKNIRNAEVKSGKKPQQQKENSQRYRKQTRDNASHDANSDVEPASNAEGNLHR